MKTVTVTPPRVRSAALDAFRGLAVVLMLVDHIALTTSAPDWLRIFPGRLAMPMFFLLAGYLATVPRWRHLWLAGIGLALPFAVPWIDNPNVLVLWALGVVALWASRRYGVPVWLLAAVGLAMGANGYVTVNGSYDVACMLGLMALGSMLPKSAFNGVTAAPAWVGVWFAVVGRHPIGWYVGHLLVLEGVRVVTA